MPVGAGVPPVTLAVRVKEELRRTGEADEASAMTAAPFVTVMVAVADPPRLLVVSAGVNVARTV